LRPEIRHKLPVAKDTKILVTGAAGFIGFHLSKELCAQGYDVTGMDNLNEYYDVDLKLSRLKVLQTTQSFKFVKLDLEDKSGIGELFKKGQFKYVVNLAAQAGVRYSLTNPDVYIDTNVSGFLNVLEACRHNEVAHLLYASSSSVYGANKKSPFSTKHAVDHPISLYAASKKANELMAHTYSALFNVPSTGLRFFSAYGPFGRPDMALFMFTKAILEGKPIDIYNNGQMKRDFTYIDDLVDGIVRLIGHVPVKSDTFDESDPSSSFAPYRLFNIGSNKPVTLMNFIEIVEAKLGRKSIRNYLPMQKGDVPEAHANIDDIVREVGYAPKVSFEEGVSRFVDWYMTYYNKSNG
jgi:UDP-glucuronate 4-epimerase